MVSLKVLPNIVFLKYSLSLIIFCELLLFDSGHGGDKASTSKKISDQLDNIIDIR